jgi:hypothetical protein
MQFVQDDECPADFVIIIGGKDIFIRLRRAVPFRRSVAELEAEFRDLIRLLRSIPGRREFWIYSKKGSLRFFRVDDAGLVEIGRDGLPLPLHENSDPTGKTGTGGTTSPPPAISPAPTSPSEKHLVLETVKKKPAEGSV